jgi:hypothetical protein
MTTGVDIVGALLCADNTVLAMFAAEQIKAGRLPDGVRLPALLVKTTSTTERQTLKRGATTRTIDRVSVTVRAGSYEDQRRAIGLVTKCCAGLTGNIGGGRSVSILTAGTGPELDGPGNSYERTQDFRVSYDAV